MGREGRPCLCARESERVHAGWGLSNGEFALSRQVKSGAFTCEQGHAYALIQGVSQGAMQAEMARLHMGCHRVP